MTNVTTQYISHEVFPTLGRIIVSHVVSIYICYHSDTSKEIQQLYKVSLELSLQVAPTFFDYKDWVMFITWCLKQNKAPRGMPLEFDNFCPHLPVQVTSNH